MTALQGDSADGRSLLGYRSLVEYRQEVNACLWRPTLRF